MTGLPWVRLDTNCFSHDKTLWLIEQRGGDRAFNLYIFGLAYAGGHGTDGFIPRHVLGHIHGTEKAAQLLVEARFWEYAEGGWQIRNWDQRQELSTVTDMKRSAAQRGGRKRACQRYHPPGCTCWRDSDAEIVPLNRGTRG